MFEGIDLSLVDWSRAQFALTALYHWIFVPLTLGIIFIIAIMEGIYVKTGDEKWAKTVKFWMKLMAINFAIGVATGIILEFEFGTNWANYSWFVGDIFGAPLAIEGIMAFFLESVMMAVMFWGWGKISKKAHLRVTWATAIGTNLSAIWILVANSWMQYPVGMQFNPDLMRNEMVNFWEVIFSPIAMNKFLHVVSASYMYTAAFIIMISCYYLLKGREKDFAKKSILIAATFGLLASVITGATGDIHAKEISKHQPMKLAAMEAFYDGQNGAPLKAMAVFGKEKVKGMPEIAFSVEVPKVLSFLAFEDFNAYVPGINDILYKGYTDYKGDYHRPFKERIAPGKVAIKALYDYKQAKKSGDTELAKEKLALFKANEKDFGFGYFSEDHMEEFIPNVPLLFYSFRVMVGAGTILPFLFLLILIFTYLNKIEDKKWLLWIGISTFVIAFLAQELGWVVAEVGRQPWTVYNILPTKVSTSHTDVWAVQFTFFLFLFIFTALLIAEFKLIISAIKEGPKVDEK